MSGDEDMSDYGGENDEADDANDADADDDDDGGSDIDAKGNLVTLSGIKQAKL